MSKIINIITFAVTLFTAILFAFGCQDGKNNSPLIPENQPTDLTMTSQGDLSSPGNVHYLWGYYFVKIDPTNLTSEIIPVRQISMHLNVLKFLQQTPCANCFKIAGITPGPSGTLNIDISIKHPFATPLLTGFDVRGIAMFNGNRIFQIAGLRMSDSTLGDGELMNPDGYTTLYKPSTADHGPLEGYLKGKFATAIKPNSTLNGYKRFISDDPANTRNVFYAGDTIIATYNVRLPSPMIFGYAIDANWAPAKNKPVTDPMTDFGPEANCPEPWKIDIIDLGPGLTESGGTTELQINVYDHGGKDSHSAPIVECPDVFEGTSTASLIDDFGDYSSWNVSISNTELAVVGDYRCLVSVEDSEDDPIGKPWMDLFARQVFPLNVAEFQNEFPMALAAAEPNPQTCGEPINFVDNGSYDPDGGTLSKYEWDWDNDGIFDEEGDIVTHTWNDPGTYFVQFRVTDNEGTSATLDSPLEIVITICPENLVWAKRAGGPGRDEGRSVAALSDNSIAVTGIFDETATFGEGEPNQTQLVSEDEGDIFIARYNPDGTLVWAKRAGGMNWIFAHGITALSDDSTVITGEFQDTAIFGEGEPNQTELTSVGEWDIFVARYNPDGTLAWAKRAGGITGLLDFYSGWGITTLSDDSVVITGYLEDTAIFGEGEPNQTELVSAGNADIFVARYNPDGTLSWAKRAGGIDMDLSNAVTTLSDDSIVITGIIWNVATFGEGEPNQTELEASIIYGDIFVARFNPDGTLEWAKRAGGTYNDEGLRISALSDDSAIVTGYFDEAATFGPGEANQTQLVSIGDQDIFIARFDASDGNLIWAKRAGGASYDQGYGITALSDDSFVASGYFNYIAIFGPGEINQTQLISAGDTNIFIAHYNTDGTLEWVKRAGGISSCDTFGITTLSDDSTVATGDFRGTATFGPCEPNKTVLISDGKSDIFIARFLP